LLLLVYASDTGIFTGFRIQTQKRLAEVTTMKTKAFLFIPIVMVLLVGLVIAASGQTWTPIPVKDDPLVRMPGTQPNQVASLESPNRCFNCHAGYNQQVEPGFNWRGSMMAQASRDFLFWACMTVSAQDSIYAIGTPNAVDLCERCHFPTGWLDGRSDPPNASAMTGADYDGVSCDFCHNMYDPHFETAMTREGVGVTGYWDETNKSSTPSNTAATTTYNADKALAGAIKLLNGAPFFTNNLPPTNYTEAASGQYFIGSGQKRASFADATGRHQQYYSRFHKSQYFCAACHDVSNPALVNLGAVAGSALPSELNSAHSYYHVERTFSEFMLSAYGSTPGGAAGIGPFTPDQFLTSSANNYISKCQDCHMRDVSGRAANKNDAILRPDGSIEHPNSGQPLHDLTGGNIWVSYVLASAVTGSPVYNATNSALLNQGPNTLTLDLNQGMGVDPNSLLAGVQRAKEQLNLAAAITDIDYNSSTGALTFNVQNQTGHKLISGFPEGRRMFVNVKAYQGGAIIQEINAYDDTIGTIKGVPGGEAPLDGSTYMDELVYEMKPSSTLTGETQGTFHFVLATGRYKDNRIPPMGFDIANARDRLAQPVWKGADAYGMYTDAEYAGGYDKVNLSIQSGADRVEVNLYYQVTSREYIAFLRDEIKGTADKQTLPSSAYVAQSDPFFAKLRAWGDTIWKLWWNNKDLPGAAPYLMASTSWQGTQQCTMPEAPQDLTATPGNKQISLAWSGVTGADSYNVYYDQAGKSQLIAGGLTTTSYTDINLTNGQTYCYKVSAVNDCGESTFSTVQCATVSNQGSLTSTVNTLETGLYVKSGKTTNFNLADTFTQGNTIVFRAYVKDASGNPISNAKVDLLVSGPSNVQLVTNPSNAEGLAEISWTTSAPNKKGVGGTPTGSYTVEVVNITATGYVWDGARTPVAFTIQ
jgi:hypothetical protein